MKKRILAAFCGLAIALSGIYAFAAEASFGPVDLSGDKTDGMYTGAVTVEYEVSDEDGISEVQIMLGDEKVASKSYEKDEDGNAVKELPVTADDSIVLTKKILKDNEPSGYEYKGKLIVIDKNDEKAETEFTFTADASVPQITVSGVENDKYYNEKTEKIELEVKVSDKNIENAKYSVKIENGNSVLIDKKDIKASESFSYSSTTEGVYKLTVTAEDKAGHTVTETRSFTYDKSSPNIKDPGVKGYTTRIGDKDWFYDSNIGFTILGEFSDVVTEVKSVNVTLNDIPVVVDDSIDLKECTLKHMVYPEWFEKNASEDGKYKMKIVVTDTAGNRSKVEHTFYADMRKPQVSMSGVKDGSFINKVPEITLSASDDMKNGHTIFFYAVNGEEKVSETYTEDKVSYNSFDKDGFYELSVCAKDGAGNTSNEKTVSFTLDRKNPEIKNAAVSGHKKDGFSWYDGEENIVVSADVSDELSGVETVELLVNGKSITYETLQGTEEKSCSYVIGKSWFKNNESEDGTYNIHLITKDRAGNTAEWKDQISVDVEAPSVNISGVDEGNFYNKKPEVNVKVTDNYKEKNTITVNITKDGEEYDTVSQEGSTVTYNAFTGDGKYEMTAYSVDKAGNVSEEKSVSFTYDTTAPSWNESFAEGSVRDGYTWFYNDVMLEASAMDPVSGVSEISVSVNGVERNTISHDDFVKTSRIKEDLPKDYFIKNESETGEYKVTFTAKDRAGNVSEKEISFYADVTSPELTLTGIEEGTYTNKTPTITAVSKDNYKEKNTILFDVNKDNKNYKTKSEAGFEASFSGFDKDGDYVISAKAVDKAGNTSKAKGISFTKDTVAPVLDITGAKEDSYTTGAKTITAHVNERNYHNMTVNGNIVKELDGKETVLGFKGIDPDSSDYEKSKKVNGTGTYTVTLSATDKAGNKAKNKTLVFTIDNDKPVIEITGVAKSNGYDASVTPKVTYEDSYFADCKITLSRADGKSGKVSFKDSKNAKGGTRTYSNFAKVAANDGVYTLTCTVKDKAGNTETETTTFAVNRFGSVYEVSRSSKPLNKTYNRELDQDIVITEYNVTGLTEYEAVLSKDGIRNTVDLEVNEGTRGGWKSYSYVFDQDLFSEEGVYDLNLTSKDTEGNFSEFSKDDKSFKIYIDKTPPTVSVAGIEEGGAYKGSESKASVSVRDSIKLSSYVITYGDKVVYDSKQEEKLMEETEVILPPGFNEKLTVKAKDAAGNEETYIIEDVTVSDNFLYRLWANKPLCIALGIMAIAAAGIIIFLARRKRDDNDVE